MEACTGNGAAGGMAQNATPAARVAEVDMDRARSVKRAHLASLISDPAVLGVGIAAGNKPHEAAIVVFVERGKVHRAIPATLDGIATAVRTIGRLRAFSGDTCSAADQVRSSLLSLR